MDHFDAILYINLEHRTDRNEHILNEIGKLCSDSTKIHRIDAIKREPGALGCGLSHIKALEFALEHSEWNNILVLEDDFTFKSNDSNAIQNDVLSIMDPLTNFDVIVLSYNHNYLQSINTPYINIKKVNYTQTTSSYIIKNKYIPKLIGVFKDAMSDMELNGKKHENCIDIAWSKLQPSDNWYAIFPAIGYQYDGYSDVERMHVSYKC